MPLTILRNLAHLFLFIYVVLLSSVCLEAAVSKKGPDINGLLQGDLYQLQGDAVNMNSGGRIEGFWYLPGTPILHLQGGVIGSGGIEQGTGPIEPSDYTIRLNKKSYVGSIVNRTLPVTLPVVSAPFPADGNRTVHINQSGDTLGDASTIRSLNINASGALISLPAGNYDRVSVNGESSLVMGEAGGSQYLEYSIQQLNLNGKSELVVVGPVVLRLGKQFNPNSLVGNTAHPEWLRIELANAGMNLNSKAKVFAVVLSPNNSVHINGLLEGGLYAGKIKINSNGIYRERASLYLNENEPPVADSAVYELLEDSVFAETLSASDPNADSLIFSVLQPTAHGLVTLSDSGQMTYTPEDNYFGVDQFVFQVNDGEVSSEPATVQLNVLPVNDLPVVQAEPFSVLEDTGASISLIVTDVDNDTFSLVINAAENGSLTGTLTNLIFSPALNYTGPASFSLTISDNNGGEISLTENFTVGEVNDPPLPTTTAFSINEDALLAGSLEATDVENDALIFALVSESADGSLSILPDGSFTYSPDVNFYGLDSFEASVEDALGALVVFEVRLTVNPINDAPIAMSAALEVNEDAVLGGLLGWSDIDNDVVSFGIGTPAEHGVVDLNADGGFVYTPNANYFGSDSFTFIVDDGEAVSNAAVVSIDTLAVNDAPVAQDLLFELNEDDFVSASLRANDADGDALLYQISSLPENGQLLTSAGELIDAGDLPLDLADTGFRYQPSADFSGIETFDFIATDGSAASAATVTLTVLSVNDVPVANDDEVTTAEDTPVILTVLANDLDADGDSLVVLSVDHVVRGSTFLNPDYSITFTPATNFHGFASFEYTIGDGNGLSATATVTINVTPVNDEPVATDSEIVLDEDTVFSGELSSFDVDGDSLNYSLLGAAGNGTVLVDTDGSFSYTPYTNFNGATNFTYSVSDGELIDTATVNITVVSVNDQPLALAQSLQTNEDAALPLTLSGSDPDGDSISYTVSMQPEHGTLTGMAPELIYAPDANYYGPDRFDFEVSDGVLGSFPAIIYVDVLPMNDSPIAMAQEFTLDEDSLLSSALLASDIDEDTLTFALSENVLNGVLSLNADGSFTYTPEANFSGEDTFLFTVSDGALTTGPLLAQLTIYPLNDAPVAQAQSLDTNEDSALGLTLAASDLEGDSLTFFVVDQPTHGLLSGVAPNLVYTPNGNYSGPDSFTFTASDAELTSDLGTIALNIIPVNDMPSAIAQSISFVGEGPILILLSGEDIDGDELDFSIKSSPMNGTLSGEGSMLEYTPNLGFAGIDSFQFIVNDGVVDSLPGVVEIEVSLPNTPPSGENVSYLAYSAFELEGQLPGFDAEGDELIFRIEGALLPSSFSINSDGSFAFVAQLSDLGTYEFVYFVSDGNTESGPFSVDLSVQLPASVSVVADETEVRAGNPDFLPSFSTIIVNNDEWTLSDRGFRDAPTTVQFVRNLVQLFAPQGNGRFLVHSNNFGYNQATLRQEIESLGHALIKNTSAITELEDLEGYDAVFLNEIQVPFDILFDYSVRGGSVYINSVGGSNDGNRWNSFLNLYGLAYGSRTNPYVGAFPITSDHPLLNGVNSLFYFNGNNVETLETVNPYVEMVHEINGDGLLAVYSSPFGYDQVGQVTLSSNFEIIEGDPSLYNKTWRLPDGLDVLYEISTSINNDILTINFYEPGEYVFSRCLEVNGQSLCDSVTITAKENGIPYLVSAPPSVFVKGDSEPNSIDSFELEIVDPDGDPIIFDFVNGPVGMSVQEIDGKYFIVWAVPNGITDFLNIDLEYSDIYGAGNSIQWNASVLYNQGPTISVDSSYFLPEMDRSINLSAIVDDDGLPLSSELAVSWSVLLAPNGANYTFSDPNAADTLFSFDLQGFYYLNIDVSDGALLTSEIIAVRVGNNCMVEAPEGLVAWFPLDYSGMDEVSKLDSVLNDPRWKTGRVGAALNSAAERDAILVPERAELDIGSSAAGWSIEFWMDPDGNPSNSGTISSVFEWSGESGRGLRLRYEWLQELRLLEGANSALTLNYATGDRYLNPDSGWYHIGFTYDRSSGSLRMYRNGSLSREWSVGDRAFDTAGDLWIGGRPLTDGYFDGGIDELSLYERPLSQSEVYAIYAAGEVGKCPLSGNRVPGVYAGEDTSIAGITETANLIGDVVDDGLPETGSLSVAWSQSFGPGDVDFTTPESVSTDATFSAEGIYILKLEASDGLAINSDLVSVRVGNNCMVEAPEGLVAWFPLDYSGLDEVTKLDSVVNDPRWKTGRVGAALNSAAERDAILVPERAELDIGSSAAGWSIEFWMDPDGNPSDSGTISSVFEWSGESGRGLRLRYEWLQELRLLEGGNSGLTLNYATGDRYLNPDSGWYHIGFTYDRSSGSLRMYRNGSLSREWSVGDHAFDTAGDLWIGGRPLTDGYFDGGIDELSLYERPLSHSELYAIYAAGELGKCPLSGNRAPAVYAGEDTFIEGIAETVSLAGNVIDDGLPETGSLSVSWSQSFGPGTVNFTTAGSVSTDATFSAEGIYILKLEASDGLAISSDLVSVRVGNNCMVEAPEGLVAWFPLDYSGLDEVSKLDSVVNDPRWKTGRVGAALNSAAERDAILVPERAELDIGSSAAGWSIEFWMDPDGNPSNSNAISSVFEWSGESGRGLRLRYEWLQELRLLEGPDSSLTLNYARGNFYLNPSSGWYHIGLTYDRLSGSLRMYRNGSLSGEWSVGDRAFDTAGDLWIGGRPLTDGYFDGGIDELSLYVRPLSQSEITDIYTAGSLGKCKPDLDNTPPVILAAFPMEILIPHTSTPIVGLVRDDGLPIGSDILVTWSLESGPDVVSFSQPSFLNPPLGMIDTNVTFNTPGNYVLAVEASDGAYNSRKEYSVYVREVVNLAPKIDAGENQVIKEPILTATLNGFASDDGLPIESSLSYNWSVFSGDGAVTFADTTSLNTRATFEGAGTYVLQASVFDGELMATDTITVVVQPKDNVAPAVTITGEVTHNFAELYTLEIDLVEDGYPEGNNLTASWRKLSGPGSVNFTPQNFDLGVLEKSAVVATLDTGVEFSQEGIYRLELLVTDGEKVTFVEKNIDVFSIPRVWMVYPEEGRVFSPLDTILFSADAYINGQPVDTVEYFVNGVSIGFGELIEGSISYPLSLSVSSLGLSNERAEVYAVAAAASGRRQTSDIRTFVVADQTAATLDASIEAPLDGATLTKPTTISGSAASEILDEWTLEYRLQGESSWTAVSQISDTSASIEGGILGTFDPTMLLNGIYDLRLRVSDLLGRTLTDQISVAVDGSMKVGNFALAFEDLTVPMAGIPIQIVRSYDSRDTRMGDFGTGWSLAINDIRLQKNGPLGTNWYHEQIETTFAGFQSFNYCLEPTGNRLVSINFPGGEQYLFELSIDVGHGRQDIADNCQLFSPIYQSTPVYTPKGDTIGKLEAVGPTSVYNFPFIGSTELYTEDPITDFNAPVYNPTRFILTTTDGTRYLIDENDGLISMEDLNGNTLEIFDDRIVSTAKDPNGGADIIREVNFLRDGEGRITQIADPEGNTLEYAYEAGQGGLRTFTNRVDETTEFVYADTRYPDYLTDILDPRGVQAIRTEYDTEGRILRQIDADGNPINFDHDLDNFTERVTDRLGNTTTYYYDDLGNVTRQVDPLGAETLFEYYPGTELVKYETDDAGNVISRAYDSRENLLVEITGALTSEEPLTATTGFITRYSYNEFSSPLTITDPNGNLTEFTYDSRGNLLRQIQHGAQAETLTTEFTYTNGGDIASITDALGNVTSYTYAYGISDASFPTAVKSQTVTITDATLGVLRVTESLYDSQENLLVERFIRTLADGSTQEIIQTSYRYDEENRLLATIFPPALSGVEGDGQVAETRYNNIGKEAASIRWQSLADYQSNDLALARVTTMTYDDRGNAVRTDYPDGTYTEAGYNPEGRMIWSSNQLGQINAMAYDALGRQTHTLSPGGTSSTSPEPVEAVSSADLAAISWNTYNELPSAFADYTVIETLYDNIGRVEFTIDALGNLTQNIYDDACACAGRLKETRRYLDPEDADSYLSTAYTYDANGNQRYVTDPKGNTTEFVYDDYNRLAQTNHPETAEHGATNSQTGYDALGRRIATLDQEDKRIEYSYDALGRLVEVRQEDPQTSNSLLQTASYTYDEAGNRLTETDAEGHTTRFEYDSMGRRTKRILPEGGEETYLYNAWGELESRTSFNGETTSYSYDAMSRLLTERADATAFPSEVGITFTYDALGRIKTMVDASGTTTMSYDPRGNLLSKTNAASTLTYTYDAANNLKSTNSGSDGGLDLAYTYDGLNRLDTVTDSGAAQPPLEHSYTYDANGNLKTLTYSNSVQHIWTYDSQNRLKDLSVLNSSFQILNAYAYTLQASGHRTQMVEATGRTVSYTLDNQYRLTQETISGEANPLLNGTSDWEYDLVGNRLSQLSDIDQIANASETYSDNNWLDTHTYDANGNTIRSAQLQQASVTLHDTYDWRNRLITRQRSDGTIIEIVYDGFGDRMEKTVRNASFLILNSTKFLVDRNSLTGYAQVVEEIGEGDELQVIYTYGLDLISQDRRDDDLSGNFTQSFYLYDGLGSIRALTDSTGAITDTYTYDAWGVLINQTSSLTRPTTNAFRFTGEQWDEDLGMYFLRARYLNVTTGRFHTMDTFEGVTTDPITLHKYLYANANPAMFIDPSGYRSILAISLGNFVRGLVLRTYSLQAITTRAFLSSGIQSVKLLYASRYLPSLARALEDFGNQARGLSDFALARRLYNTSNAVDQVFLGALSGSIVGVSASVALGPVALLANLIGVGNAVASYGETVVEGVGDAATAAGISCNVKFDITSSSTRRLIVDILTFNIQPDLLVNAAADSYVGGRTGDLGRFLEGQMFFQQNFCNRYR